MSADPGFVALAARLDAHAAIHEDERLRGCDDEDEQRQWAEDLRAAAQLARERTEAPEPFGWVGSDGIRQNPDVQVIGPESTHWAVPLYLHPPAAQPAPQPQPRRPYGTDTMSEMGIVPMCDEPQREPTYLDPTAVALGLAWSEDGQADSVEPTEYIYIRLKRPEGYEDVHPDLVLEDANINPAFEAEVVSEPTCKQALQVEPTEAQIEEYEILCNGEWVAGANGPGARAEILHYLTQYEQDGPCEVYAITRRLVDRAALAARETK